MRAKPMDPEKLAALRALLKNDALFEEFLRKADWLEQTAKEMGLAYKQAQPAGPLDQALDHLRQALETARQQQGDAQLVKLLDGFTATLKPTAQGGGGARVLHDTDKPSAAREKEASVDGFFDDLGIGGKPAPAPADFYDFVMPGERKRQ